MAITSDTLFGYLNQAANRIPELQDRFQSNMRQDIGEELRNISSDITFEDPVFNQIEDTKNIQPTPYTGIQPGLDLSKISPSDLSNLQMKLGVSADGIYGPETQKAYNDWVSQNQNFVTPNNAPITNTSSLPQNKLNQASSAYAYAMAGDPDANPYNKKTTVEQSLANSLASQAPTEAPTPQYRVEGGNIPLNEDMYQKMIADRYQQKFGLTPGEAQRRVNESGLFGRTAFLNKIEPHQKRISEKVMDELRGVDFETPDDYRKFMIDSGLMKIVNQLGPYSKNLGHAPDLKYNLGVSDMDLFDDIYK
tara:strand:- start:4774 stop:5694 length:921 start_codon:yes stop_codon:yes gene_type:complete